MKHLTKMITIGAVAALALTGCSSSNGGGDDAAAPSSENMTDVQVGILTIAPSVAMQYGIDEGIFAEHGLNVELQTGQGGAALLPALSSGSMAFAIGNPLSGIVATEKGLDIKIVTGYSNSKADGEDINGVVAKKSSGIESFADLEDKKVSVNTLKTQGDLTISESVKIDGGDPAKVNFLEMPFPDMEAQLSSDNVDAIWIPEPFLSKALADPNNVLIGYPNQTALPGLPTMVALTSGKYATENPKVVKAFQEAMAETLTKAEENPEAVRALLPSFMDMPEAVATNLRMETLDAEVPTQVLSDLGDLMVEYKYVEKTPDVKAMIVSSN
ncbi:ABC transporter substrate-binding protein [Lysinibacter cavernae]|uniref:NitT/TauT family transport system substrate-binding protein n=1 Tax=Lysinibacter cavernae TaxID=1640652 RepID=A0A7X5R064_9MICO|nr:ABC transporter substrate-binding protein [Lysinibacter cavernae]NIH53235.1 NitT/TauT family transport system substrate-binding protein [Lysinibacter cavernae]